MNHSAETGQPSEMAGPLPTDLAPSTDTPPLWTDVVDRVERTLDAVPDLAEELAGDQIRPQPATQLPTIELSVVIPVYNERDTIREIVRRVQAVPLDIAPMVGTVPGVFR